MRRPAPSFWLALLVVAALGAVVGTRLDVTTDMTRFMPTGEARDQANLMREFASSELSRTMILLLEAPDQGAAVEASRAFETALRATPAVAENLAFLEGGPPQGLDRAFWELYQPRRLSFLARTPEEAKEHLTHEALVKAAERLKDRLGTPMSALVTRAAPGDPLMITAGMLDSLQPTRAAGLTMADGRFVTTDGKGAVVFLGTKASAFNAGVQEPLLDGIQAAFAKVNESAKGTLKLRQSGVNRIAVAAQASMKSDIQRVSVVSVVSVIVLFLVLFGSLRIVAITMVPITAGILAGMAGCLLLFGSVHGLTLAFGAALIGVCIDYCAHTYCHHQLEAGEGEDATHTVRKVWSGLALGATTTITGFVALSAATFPGLKEVGVFGALGVGAALASTRWLVPPLMGRGGTAKKALAGLSAGLERALDAGRKRRAVLIVLPLACAGVIAAAWPNIVWQDDLSEFGRIEGPLMDEDEAVRAQVTPFEQRRFVLAVGKTDEEALQANDVIARRLEAAQAAGEVESYRTVAPLVPSAATQTSVAAAVKGDTALWGRLEKAFAEAGFNAAAFEPFKGQLAAEVPAPVTFDQLLKSPVAPLVRPFHITLGERVAFVTFLTGVKDTAALRKRMDGVAGAEVLDFAAVMSTAYGGYRQRMIELLLIGLAVVLLLLGLRYRNPRLVAAALAPSLLASVTTLAVLSLAGMSLSVLTVTALLMVVCMGVDYGVFLAETAAGNVQVGPTMAALAVAAVSTLLGFGLLSLSDHPSLKGLGLTAAVGVGLSVLLAPTALALTTSREGTAK